MPVNIYKNSPDLAVGQPLICISLTTILWCASILFCGGTTFAAIVFSVPLDLPLPEAEGDHSWGSVQIECCSFSTKEAECVEGLFKRTTWSG